MKTKMKEPEAGEHEVHLNFNPNAMIRVLQLAVIAAKNDEDKQHIFTVADLADRLMRPQGGFHLNTLTDIHSARALVEELIGLKEDFAKGTPDAGKQRQLKQVQELIDEFSSQSSRAKKGEAVRQRKFRVRS